MDNAAIVVGFLPIRSASFPPMRRPTAPIPENTMSRKRAAPDSHDRSLMRRSRTKSNAGDEKAATKNATPASGQKCFDSPMPSALVNGIVGASEKARLSGRNRARRGNRSSPSVENAKRIRHASSLASAIGKRSSPRPTPSEPASPKSPMPNALTPGASSSAMRTMDNDAMATIEIRTSAWLTANTIRVGMNAVNNDPRDMRAKAARRGFLRPVLSAVMANSTPSSEAVRMPAKRRLIWPSVNPKSSLTKGSVWAIWLAA